MELPGQHALDKTGGDLSKCPIDPTIELSNYQPKGPDYENF